MKKRITALVLMLSLLLTMFPSTAFAAGEEKKVRILFTHDIHSHLEPTVSVTGGMLREHGGAARLATILDEYRASAEGDAVYLDGGDFSQGTLFQAGYETDGLELSMLASLNCLAACPGNHEWDHAGTGFANMLNSVMDTHDTLPMLLCANLNFSGDLNEEQTYVKDTMAAYAEKSGQDHIGYSIVTLPETGLKLGLFGLSGINSIEDSPTSGMVWDNYIESAKTVVAELENKCDLIVCLSHAGTSGDGENGEDIELAKEVPGIDFILSGHSHTTYREPAIVNGTIIGSAGEYLSNVGCLDLVIDASGNVTPENYQLIPVDETVSDEPAMAKVIEEDKASIGAGYLKEYGYDYSFDEKLAHSNFDFISLDEMYATHDEYPMGDLIADSYFYEAEKYGYDDIDVMLVGLGTIRGSFFEGDISVADAFNICSLGAGEDGSAGHPLLSAYITGEELSLLVELDASLGPMVSSIKMSYAGLEYEFNTKRMLLDRVTSLHLLKKDGTTEEIEDDKLYKVCCNMYAANMLGMLNGLTKGILSIVPKYEDGTPIEDFYTCALKNSEGKEIKEWVAFADYLSSFEVGESGLPEIPECYRERQGRKVKIEEGGIQAVKHPGLTTIVVMALIVIVLLVLSLILVKALTKRQRHRQSHAEAPHSHEKKGPEIVPVIREEHHRSSHEEKPHNAED